MSCKEEFSPVGKLFPDTAVELTHIDDQFVRFCKNVKCIVFYFISINVIVVLVDMTNFRQDVAVASTGPSIRIAAKIHSLCMISLDRKLSYQSMIT